MPNPNRETLAIVISDVHLGDLYCKLGDFELFLTRLYQKIQDGGLPYLKMVILLGDFFDIIMNSFWDLCNNQKYLRIYEILQNINDHDILIVFVLGNHEIYTTGFYNIFFKSRKKEFLNRMRENGFYFSFLNEDVIAHYLLLCRNGQDALTLSLYDSIENIVFNENNELELTDTYYILSNEAFFNNSYYFMTHGYQFENWNTHHIITAPWWKGFMRYDEDVKRDINRFWHELRTQRDSFKSESLLRYMKSRGIRTNHLQSGNIKKFIRHEIYERNQRFYDNAVKLLKNNGINMITHVVFGHTHDALQVKDGDLLLMNIGCWLQNRQTQIIEILVDGNYAIRKI
ncbi:hypothetical protein LCGC14_2000270 [marine sediment metagenome]|uniref:Calcineurin-like phosphoesterase domain-containing protein n=1 Tax=marine sediment metagenome TaxID=412755 RepID=A0A0F9FRB5_9ZZZZ